MAHDFEALSGRVLGAAVDVHKSRSNGSPYDSKNH